MADKKSKNGNRYSGVDSVNWIVRDTTGKQVGTESFASFKEAESAANTYRISSGLYAGAVRS